MSHPHPPLGLLVTSLVCAATSGLLPATPPLAPPPFVLPPPAHPDPAAAIPVALRAATATAHARWKAADGGADFHPTLTYLRDKPALMLVTATDEPGPKALRRKRAIVQAAGFLLDDTAFARAIVCVVEIDARHPDKPRVRNYDLRRPAFQAVVRAATHTADPRQALRQAREVDDHTLRICADLGID
jgi:hypothetical protein